MEGVELHWGTKIQIQIQPAAFLNYSGKETACPRIIQVIGNNSHHFFDWLVLLGKQRNYAYGKEQKGCKFRSIHSYPFGLALST